MGTIRNTKTNAKKLARFLAVATVLAVEIANAKSQAAIAAEMEADTTADVATDESAQHAMSRTLRRYRKTYVVSVAANGRKSLRSECPIAAAMEGLGHLDVAGIADWALGLPSGHHAALYSGLNNGQIRMCSGNKIRNCTKRGERTVAEIVAYVERVRSAQTVR